MAQNKLLDLNNHLFEALERLNDDDLMQGDRADQEIKRAKAIADVGQTIINNANVMLDTIKVLDDYGYQGDHDQALQLLGFKEDK